MTVPLKRVIHLPRPRRRTVVDLAALWLLLALAAIVIWQILQTANASLPAMPTLQPEATLAPVVGQVALALPTNTPEETPSPMPTPSPIPTIPCEKTKIPREMCSVPYTILPTPTPLLRCDDSRLIGGQFCVWPAPTPTPTEKPAVESLWE